MKHIIFLSMVLTFVLADFGCKRKESEPQQQTAVQDKQRPAKKSTPSEAAEPAMDIQLTQADTQNETSPTKPVTTSTTGIGNPELDKSLQEAVTAGDIDKIKSILASGADVNAKARNGASLLHIALLQGHEAAAVLLIAQGADTHAKMTDGTTTLHFAVLRNCKEIARFLLDDGVDANSMGANLGTPLHIAATTGQTEIAEMLIAKGADVNIKNKRDQTPLALAKMKNDAAMIELLEKHGTK